MPKGHTVELVEATDGEKNINKIIMWDEWAVLFLKRIDQMPHCPLIGPGLIYSFKVCVRQKVRVRPFSLNLQHLSFTITSVAIWYALI